MAVQFERTAVFPLEVKAKLVKVTTLGRPERRGCLAFRLADMRNSLQITRSNHVSTRVLILEPLNDVVAGRKAILRPNPGA